ncbi:MAG: Slp family lipoprotein [Gammaproteobacteria bacterium]|nr:Slp family lipoprotein [Gammaproteobacteria bacterium]
MKKYFTRILVAACMVLFISACATKPPFDASQVDKKITPEVAVSNFSEVNGETVVWGGVIVSNLNTNQGTEFEILAYPLDKKLMPDSTQTPQGRFLAFYPQYLESVDYAPGRLITVMGKVSQIVESKIGEADYRYPKVQAEKQHLWKTKSNTDTRFHFGVGVIFTDYR